MRRGAGPALERRGLLAAALAAPLLAAGCSKGFGALGTPPSPAPEVAVLTGAMKAEQLMIARYEAALARSPALAATLDPLLAEHRAHLAALTARLLPGAARPAPSPSASPRVTVPAGAAPAVAYLAAAESSAAAAFLRQLAAVSPSLAQLLASIAASEATHAAVLGAPGRAAG